MLIHVQASELVCRNMCQPVADRLEQRYTKGLVIFVDYRLPRAVCSSDGMATMSLQYSLSNVACAKLELPSAGSTRWKVTSCEYSTARTCNAGCSS